MVLTGRAALVALLCVLPIAFAPDPAVAFALLWAVLAVAVVADIALAASPRALELTRSGDSAVRLGQSVDTVLDVRNPGRRRFRGRVRDAWPPSAHGQPRTHEVNLIAGQQVTLRTTLRPTRRGDLRSALVTARSIGPLGLAGRRASHRVATRLRVLPPFLSRKHLPSRLARLRELDGSTPP